MPQAAVSQQLARLRLDGLVDARGATGRNIYYALASDEVKTVIGTLHRPLSASRHAERRAAGPDRPLAGAGSRQRQFPRGTRMTDMADAGTDSYWTEPRSDDTFRGSPQI